MRWACVPQTARRPSAPRSAPFAAPALMAEDQQRNEHAQGVAIGANSDQGERKRNEGVQSHSVRSEVTKLTPLQSKSFAMQDSARTDELPPGARGLEHVKDDAEVGPEAVDLCVREFKGNNG